MIVYQPVAMVDQDGNQLQQPVPAHTEQQKQLQQQMQMQQQALIQQQEQQKQLQQAFLSEVRSFDQENENANKKRPRTSDADFNKDKTNLIVNYLPQVIFILLLYLRFWRGTYILILTYFK